MNAKKRSGLNPRDSQFEDQPSREICYAIWFLLHFILPSQPDNFPETIEFHSDENGRFARFSNKAKGRVPSNCQRTGYPHAGIAQGRVWSAKAHERLRLRCALLPCRAI